MSFQLLGLCLLDWFPFELLVVFLEEVLVLTTDGKQTWLRCCYFLLLPAPLLRSVQKHIEPFLVFLKKLLLSTVSTGVDEYLKPGRAEHGLLPRTVSTQFS